MSHSESLTAAAVALRHELRNGLLREVATVPFGSRCASIRLGSDSLWAIVDGDSEPKLALRLVWTPHSRLEIRAAREGVVELVSGIGAHRIEFTTPRESGDLLGARVSLTPSSDLIVPWFPRDLYVLGSGADPAAAEGSVLASQRGLSTGLVYARREGQDGGTLLYLQDLTLLNDYFRATDTAPDGVVGGVWPELGYATPGMAERPLPAGREFVVSAPFLRVGRAIPANEGEEARCFLEHVAAIYPHLEKPDTEFRDWPDLARRTVRDLSESPLVRKDDGGYRYARPYVGAGEPDSMVQAVLTAMVSSYSEWSGDSAARDLADSLRAGLYRFFDPGLGALRRYLGSLPADVDPASSDPEKVDPWYLYHPLQSLAALAKAGDDGARDLLLASLDYAIECAHAFEYRWPIAFKMSTLQIETASRKPGEALGETDAAGLYAYVMLDAFDLTGEARYFEEARRALKAAEGYSFDLAYQTNLTSWGAAACVRMAERTEEDAFLVQAEMFFASFVHNTALWEARLGAVPTARTFFGVHALHDGPYLAAFECYESFRALHECLVRGGDRLSSSFRLLAAEFLRHTLVRAWEFYPEARAETELCPKPREGVISRALSFPLEDLYVNGDVPGQVGQEVYGAGGALAFATLCFHPLGEGRLLFCELPVRDLRIGEGRATFDILGSSGGKVRARVLSADGCGEEIEATVGDAVTVTW